MKYLFIYIALAIAVIHWIAATKKWQWVVYITKPAVMLALIAYVWQLRPYLMHDNGRINWLLGALVFSLLGDIFLMLPNKFFMPGLIAFLSAHIAYILSFATISQYTLSAPFLIIIALVGLTAYQIYRGIAAGLTRTGTTQMKLPVLLYTITISAMAIVALQTLTSNGFENYRALFASAGALLFLLSDTWLAWDRFVEPLPWRDLRVMSTYHLGQVCLCLGFLMTF